MTDYELRLFELFRHSVTLSMMRLDKPENVWKERRNVELIKQDLDFFESPEYLTKLRHVFKNRREMALDDHLPSDEYTKDYLNYLAMFAAPFLKRYYEKEWLKRFTRVDLLRFYFDDGIAVLKYRERERLITIETTCEQYPNIPRISKVAQPERREDARKIFFEFKYDEARYYYEKMKNWKYE